MTSAALDPPPPAAQRVLDVLHAHGHAAWFVGGCVRDRLLGRPVGDWDVATDASPEAVDAIFERTIPTGIAHGTVTVISDELPVEVTTYRIEAGYSDGRRPDAVAFTDDLHADLARRDFTINAIAWDPASGRLEDPFDGRADLAARRLRAVGEAQRRFDEDGLRAMRAVRFACVLELAVDDETWAAIPRALATFRKVSVERIQIELTKILRSHRPAWGVGALRDAGLLGVFWPQIDAALDLAPLDRAPDRLPVRLALLWRLRTPAEAAAGVARLRYSNALRDAVAHLVRWRAPGDPTDAADVRRLVARIGVDALDDVLALRRAVSDDDALAALEARIEATGARTGPLCIRALAIDGRAVMRALGWRPSPRVGRVLSALLERVWADPACNTPERLSALLPEVGAAIAAGDTED